MTLQKFGAYTDWFGIGPVVFFRSGMAAFGDCSLWIVSDYWDYFHDADNPQFSVSTFTYLAVPEPSTLLLLGLGGLGLRKSR